MTTRSSGSVIFFAVTMHAAMMSARTTRQMMTMLRVVAAVSLSVFAFSATAWSCWRFVS